jgi:hypothetical protein
MRQEPKWPADQSAQEFLMSTLSTDQWKALRVILDAELQSLKERISELETDV